MDVSAVLLAGGQSLRMGQDKATLHLNGKPLWQIQLDLLCSLQPVEIFVSAKSDPSWRPVNVQFVPDDPPSKGPLSGLAAAMREIRSNYLLALAIDMPFMHAEHLHFLYAQIRPGCGVMPMIADRMEPLAAIYPVEVSTDFAAALSGTEFSLQILARQLIDAGKLRAIQISKEEEFLYKNLNEPADCNIAGVICSSN